MPYNVSWYGPQFSVKIENDKFWIRNHINDIFQGAPDLLKLQMCDHIIDTFKGTLD